MVVNTVRLAASQLSKVNRPIFFLFQALYSCKTRVTAEKKTISSFEVRFSIVRGKLCSSASLKKEGKLDLSLR